MERTLEEVLDGLRVPFGLDEHLVPEVELSVEGGLPPDIVGSGLERSGDGQRGEFQRVLSEFNGSLGVEVKEVVAVVGFHNSESAEQLNFGVFDLLGCVNVH